MKIYLAARYSRHPEMRERRDELAALGHSVTSRWVNGSHDSDEASDVGTKIRFAQEDFDDCLEADWVISFTEPPRVMNSSRGGRHVEHGLALASDTQRIIVIGHRENIFHWLPQVEFYDTWDECLRVLSSEARVGMDVGR